MPAPIGTARECGNNNAVVRRLAARKPCSVALRSKLDMASRSRRRRDEVRRGRMYAPRLTPALQTLCPVERAFGGPLLVRLGASDLSVCSMATSMSSLGGLFYVFVKDSRMRCAGGERDAPAAARAHRRASGYVTMVGIDAHQPGDDADRTVDIHARQTRVAVVAALRRGVGARGARRQSVHGTLFDL